MPGGEIAQPQDVKNMQNVKPCQFCGEEKPLVKSHIIPRSFYELPLFRQKAPKKALSIISDSENWGPKRQPSGLYDTQLFCEDCEKKFMVYDDYAFKLLYKKRGLRKEWRNREGQVIAEYYESYDYGNLKLFFLSVLFRAGISQHDFFQHVTLGPYLDILKETIDIGKTPPANDFAVIMQYYRDGPSGPAIFPPSSQRIENVTFYCFHLGREVFYIKLDQQQSPFSLRPFVLKPGAPLMLLGVEFRSSQAFKVLERIVQNPANSKYFSS